MKCIYLNGIELSKEAAIIYESTINKYVEVAKELGRALISWVKEKWEKVKECVMRFYQRYQVIKRNYFVKRRSTTRKIDHQVIDKRPFRILARSNC
ncbi:hypothetical protein [Halalkalibacterium ligniniphilum]|uniref:hypothetical protein n=1 Tax=Halalkalibacterium ligniniphilum TaxID=1134413 RepID=UPI000374D007|nr:hypothetical protein [Halalkalibacterium ligniniphilum]